MWALRRASHPLKNRASTVGISRLCGASTETKTSFPDDRVGIFEPTRGTFDRCLVMKKSCYCTSASSCFCTWRHNFSSHAGAITSDDEDNVEDGFSELETSASAVATQEMNAGTESEDELLSEPDLSEIDDDGGNLEKVLELSDAEVDASEKKSRRNRVYPELTKAVLAATGPSIYPVLDKWIDKDLSKEDAALTLFTLRKRRLFVQALQLSEWLEKNKKFDLTEKDYASRVDLIAKVRGFIKAESYTHTIPKSFKGEVVYCTLLAHAVRTTNVKKAEGIFNRMKDLELPITCFACNQLILLYKRVDKRKIGDVMILMEKENITPTRVTYNLLIDTKGQSSDIAKMEEVVKMMKAQGIEPDTHTLSIMAKHYVSGGFHKKAEAALKEMEGDDISKKPWVRQYLLPLYAALGKADEVERLWKICQVNPRASDCMAAIEAWGKLKKIEEAEAVFDKLCKTYKRVSAKQYTALLRVYAENKMLAKGKGLVKQMAESGCHLGPTTWDGLVKLYVDAGEVEKADSILHKAAHQNKLRPLFSSYMLIMDKYAERGDVHNTEKMFQRMREAGYFARIRQFQSLIHAYVKAKVPAYGLRERLKADNIFPNKSLAGQLTLVDAFRRTAASDLLD